MESVLFIYHILLNELTLSISLATWTLDSIVADE